MANTNLQIKRSSTAAAIPAAAVLSNGELAINYADGRLFFKAANGSVLAIGNSSASAYGTVVVAGGSSTVAAIPNDSLTLIPGSNITLTANAVNDSIVISASLAGGAGDVVGPGGAVKNSIAIFKDTSGKNIIDTLINIEGGGNLKSYVVDNSTNAAYTFDTTGFTGSNTIIAIDNAGVFVANLDSKGNFITAGTITGVGSLTLANTPIFSLPNPGNLTIFMAATGGKRPRIASMGSLGRSINYQESLSDLNFSMIVPVTATAAPTVIGQPALTAYGTNIVRTQTANNYLSSFKRTGFRCAATVNTQAGGRLATAWLYRGNNSIKGGFFMAATWGLAEVVSGMRLFVGLSNTVSALPVAEDGVSRLHSLAFVATANSANIRFYTANTSANITNLNSNMILTNNAVYLTKIYSPPANLDGNTYWSIERLDTPAYSEGFCNNAVSPLGNNSLTLHFQLNTATFAQNATIDLINFYAEQPQT